MFGYIIANKPELKIKEFNIYRSYYCGLCKELKKSSGNISRLLLSYDMTFLYMLLSALYEPETTVQKERCVLNPVKKLVVSRNEIAAYIADMSTIMTYYKCKDDWQDEKKIRAKMMLQFIKRRERIKNKNEHSEQKKYDRQRKKRSAIIITNTKKEYKTLRKTYEKKMKRISYFMKKIDEGEKRNSQNIDEMSGYFGNVMAQILAYKEDEWEQSLKTMGFFLGKFIYIMDAYDDFLEDEQKGNYNPLQKMRKEEGNEAFHEKVKMMLLMMMAECTKTFEQLPIIENVELLRNILYAGVWVKYEEVRKRDGSI